MDFKPEMPDENYAADKSKRDLAMASQILGQQLSLDISRTFTELGLKETEISEAQKFFSQPQDITPEQFWKETAVLRSGLLAMECKRVVDDIASQLEFTLIEGRLDAEIGEGAKIIDLEDQSFFASDDDKTDYEENLRNFKERNILNVFRSCFLDYGFDEIENTWNDELSLAADKLASTEAIGRSADPEIIRILKETELLTEPPWCYTERLLAAFAKAQFTLKKHAEKTQNALIKVFCA